MTKISSAARTTAIVFCALAGVASIPAQQAAGAPNLPQTALEPLPPVPVVEALPGIEIPEAIAAEPELPIVTAVPAREARAPSLAALVARHAGDTARNNEADCLARAIYFESKGEPLAGRLAVAQVIMNRASSGRFPRTLCGVVKQPSQFSFVRSGAFPAIREKGQWREAVAIAHIAVDALWEGPVGKALYFHAKRVSPNWGKQRIAAVGNHIFYR
ncbi:MAG: cell wall hydrolase [Sphingomonadaceae bacterium]